MVFLKLPPTREERLRREVCAETLRELRQEEEMRRAETLRELRQEEEKHREAKAEFAAKAAAWYARMKEAQDKDEPFDEPPPWEQP